MHMNICFANFQDFVFPQAGGTTMGFLPSLYDLCPYTLYRRVPLPDALPDLLPDLLPERFPDALPDALPDILPDPPGLLLGPTGRATPDRRLPD